MSRSEIPKPLTFVTGAGGLPQIRVSNAAADAVISLYGGQLLSFLPAGNPRDLLFLGSRAYFESGKAIKGGIPICWPWFGADPVNPAGQPHGFARNRLWSIETTEQIAPDHTRLTLSLTDDPDTRAIWPHAFELKLVVSIAPTLRIQLISRNTGAHGFAITQALHSYFGVGAIDRVSVEGLQGTPYLDKLQGFVRQQQRGAVTFSSEVDRIYRNVPTVLSLVDRAWQRQIAIEAEGSTTAVVWNPWQDTATRMADLADDDYRRFVCVETANAADEVIQIPPGGEYRLTASYRLTALGGA